MKGSELNLALNLKARHSLHRKSGDWYHQLKEFPGVLFDENGYLYIKNQKHYNSLVALDKSGNHLHIKNGISSIQGYKYFSEEEKQIINIFFDSSGKPSPARQIRGKSNPKAARNITKVFTFNPSKPGEAIRIMRHFSSDSACLETSHLHREICKTLYKHLCNEYKTKNIGCDCHTGHGTYIDMIAKCDKAYILFEVKTYTDIRRNIREAFGQLMEYAYWDQSKKIKGLMIIGTIKPSQRAMKYLDQIRSLFLIPLYYQQIDLSTGILSQKY